MELECYDDTCAICCESIYSNDDIDGCPHCKKIYHFKCLHNWKRVCENNCTQYKCPCCKKQLNSHHDLNNKDLYFEAYTRSQARGNLPCQNNGNQNNGMREIRIRVIHRTDYRVMINPDIPFSRLNFDLSNPDSVTSNLLVNSNYDEPAITGTLIGHTTSFRKVD